MLSLISEDMRKASSQASPWYVYLDPEELPSTRHICHLRSFPDPHAGLLLLGTGKKAWRVGLRRLHLTLFTKMDSHLALTILM